MEELGRFVDFEKLPDVRFGSAAVAQQFNTRAAARGHKRTFLDYLRAVESHPSEQSLRGDTVKQIN